MRCTNPAPATGRNGIEGGAGGAAAGETHPMPLVGPVPWEVHKFGGAALENAALYKRCGDRVIAESQRRVAAIPSAVVVSAAKGMTDMLLDIVNASTAAGAQGLAKATALLDGAIGQQTVIVTELLAANAAEAAETICQQLEADRVAITNVLLCVNLLRTASEATVEYIAGYGEIWSARVLTAYLKSAGAAAAMLDARDVLVVETKAGTTLGAKGGAVDVEVLPNYSESASRLEEWWTEGAGRAVHCSAPVVVITGFVASKINLLHFIENVLENCCQEHQCPLGSAHSVSGVLGRQPATFYCMLKCARCIDDVTIDDVTAF